MNQPAPMAGVECFASEQAAMDARVDRLLESHGGDWRALVEVLLISLDERTEHVAFGYVRGRLRR